MFKDYQNWRAEHEALLNELQTNDSSILLRIRSVINVLDTLPFVEDAEFVDDIALFVDVGLSYLNYTFMELKEFYDALPNPEDRIKYDALINACLYVNDLEEMFEEEQALTPERQAVLSRLYNEMRGIVLKRKIIAEDLYQIINDQLLAVFPNDEVIHQTTPEIFYEIEETVRNVIDAQELAKYKPNEDDCDCDHEHE